MEIAPVAPAQLGALLLRLRKRADLTQEALAERAGVSVNTISNLEAGRGHLPRAATLDLLAQALIGALAPDAAEREELRAALRAAARAGRAARSAGALEGEPPAAGTTVPGGAVVSGDASPPEPPGHLPAGRLTFLVGLPVDAATERADAAGAADDLVLEVTPALQQAVARHGGLVVRPPEGPDGVFGVFRHATAAVAAACAVQRALWELREPHRAVRAPDRVGRAARAQVAQPGETAAGRDPEGHVRVQPVPLCLALHTGWAEPGTGAYAGPTRRRTVRLARLGQAGQVLLTAATRELVGHGLPAGVRLHEMGRRRLSVVERPQPLYELRPAGQPGAVPPRRAPLAPLANVPVEPPTNLPVEPTTFIGREREQTAVSALLGQAPLVTLVGAGGCGKTRLALAAAAELLEGYPDGVWLVELAALRDPALVPQAVATVLGVREEPGRVLLHTLTDHLQAARLLLVLDNCEQVAGGCAELVALLVRRCARVQVLATGRERLGIGGERSYRVPSLALPPEGRPTVAAVSAYEGVRLFVERAQACRPDFALSAENAEVVAQICRRLDGLPLAIELAAARADSLPVGTIAARLEQSLGLLTGGPRDAPPRHQTLRATLDWSWALLGEPERVLLRRLAVFAGGWAVEAAEAVCGGAEAASWPLLGLLGGLVSKSLVGLHESGAAGRYGLLETVLAVRGRAAGGGGGSARGAGAPPGLGRGPGRGGGAPPGGPGAGGVAGAPGGGARQSARRAALERARGRGPHAGPAAGGGAMALLEHAGLSGRRARLAGGGARRGGARRRGGAGPRPERGREPGGRAGRRGAGGGPVRGEPGALAGAGPYAGHRRRAGQPGQCGVPPGRLGTSNSLIHRKPGAPT